jgi:lipopolysaccharide transport system permease protein
LISNPNLPALKKDFMQHSDNTAEWDLVIEGKTSLFDLKLRDVWRYRDLLVMFVKRDIKSVYKQTVLGPIWFFLQPLFTTFTFTFIFGNLAAISTDEIPQPLFYMTGIIAWNYFSDCLTATSTVFRTNSNIFGKVYFPRLIMPLSIVLSNLLKFGIQFLLLVLMLVYFLLFTPYQLNLNVYSLMLPIFILLMAILGLSLGMIISSLTTKYRDLSFLVGFGMSLFMYATPVIYPLSVAVLKFPKYVWLLKLNPLTGILEGFRLALLGKGSFDWMSFAYTSVCALILLAIGAVVFNKVEKSFIDTV